MGQSKSWQLHAVTLAAWSLCAMPAATALADELPLTTTTAAALPSELTDEADPISGFSTNVTGQVTGTVSDLHDTPIGHLNVYVVSPAGAQQTTTDDHGRFRVDLGTSGQEVFLYVRRIAKITAQSSTIGTLDTGEEVFEVNENETPSVRAKPGTFTDAILDYTVAARTYDGWAKAWLLLDVDREGKVARVKLLRPAGHDLDALALQAAFRLRFEPAKNRARASIGVRVPWSYEWPPYWWMIEHRHPLSRMPEEARTTPCRSAARPQERYRDCTPAPMLRAHALPWIEPVATAVALDPEKLKARPASALDHTLSWTLLGSGTALAAIAVYTFVRADTLDDRAARTSDLTASARLRELAGTRRSTAYLLGGVGAAMLTIGGVGLIVRTDGATSADVALSTRY
jgi:TonB family protein